MTRERTSTREDIPVVSPLPYINPRRSQREGEDLGRRKGRRIWGGLLSQKGGGGLL